ncbi:hypothetical protein SO802_022523 [Lithocarpus litseifolius]|uniref:Uncharacterized protein n=1 Tax=Lithocarpus litseifolius TaxID=425828 RepID=A0AAW2C990_9ROSI
MLSSTAASTSSAAMNGEKKKKACNVIRMKVPKGFKLEDYNKESDAKNVTDSTCTADSCCSNTAMMNGDDGITKKERIVVKINLAAWRQRKAQQQQMESSSSTQAINTCSEKQQQQQQQMESSSSTQAINTCSEKQEIQKEEEGKEKGELIRVEFGILKKKATIEQPGVRVLRFYLFLGKENMVEHIGDIPSVYKWEIMNKAVHAADRGGNLNVLK